MAFFPTLGQIFSTSCYASCRWRPDGERTLLRFGQEDLLGNEYDRTYVTPSERLVARGEIRLVQTKTSRRLEGEA